MDEKWSDNGNSKYCSWQNNLTTRLKLKMKCLTNETSLIRFGSIFCSNLIGRWKYMMSPFIWCHHILGPLSPKQGYRFVIPELNAQFWEHIFCNSSCFDLVFLILCCLGHMEFGRRFFYPICYDSRLAVVREQLVASPARGKWKHFHRN